MDSGVAQTSTTDFDGKIIVGQHSVDRSKTAIFTRISADSKLEVIQQVTFYLESQGIEVVSLSVASRTCRQRQGFLSHDNEHLPLPKGLTTVCFV